MQYGFVLPSGDAKTALDLAEEAERAGWDAFFVWEPVWGWDAWALLAAIAVRTSRIKLGTLISPLSRMRPWKVASETVTVDHLSNGRVILSVGLGAPETGFEAFGEQTDRKTRAALLDESLDIITGLWRGQPFSHDGKHYHVRPTDFMPPASPVQQPRIPIWTVGAWPSKPSMARALRYDGILPTARGEDGNFRRPTADEVRELRAHIDASAVSRPFDIIVEGETSGTDAHAATAIVGEWRDAGATWWIEAQWEAPLDAVRARVQAGPPRVAVG